MPAADAELEAKIVPDESAIEEVEERELELGGGGELSSSQENKRSGIISGGFKTALLSLGIVGLLAQLKPITASLSAIFGVLGRALLPTIEVLAELLRPVGEFVNDFIADPVDTVGGKENVENFTGGVEFGTSLLPGGFLEPLIRETAQNPKETIEAGNPVNIIEGLVSTLQNVSDGGAGSPDQSGEAKKMDIANQFDVTKQDKTGATK